MINEKQTKAQVSLTCARASDGLVCCTVSASCSHVISILCSVRLAACTRALSKSLIHVIHMHTKMFVHMHALIQGSPSMVRMLVVLLPALCGWATPVPLAATFSDSKVMKKKYYVAHSVRQKHSCCVALAVSFSDLNHVISSHEWNVLWNMFKALALDALDRSMSSAKHLF